MENKEVLNKILYASNMLNELQNQLFGIRNVKTNKFLRIGLLEKDLIYCDSDTEYATLWNVENAESVYKIMAQNDEFKKNYFVDKVRKEDYELI